eukprot:3971242-Prymnesium_polylepis.2
MGPRSGQCALATLNMPQPVGLHRLGNGNGRPAQGSGRCRVRRASQKAHPRFWRFVPDESSDCGIAPAELRGCMNSL